MFTGFILRPVERTVCGMLTGAGRPPGSKNTRPSPHHTVGKHTKTDTVTKKSTKGQNNTG